MSPEVTNPVLFFSGIPNSLVNMRSGSSKNFGWASGGSSILAEFGTMHMEFAYLSDITGNPVYRQKVERVREVLASVDRPKGLYPNYLNPKTGKWGQFHTSMGALGDSFYEYLVKEWVRSGRRDRQARDMYVEAANDVADQLVKTSPGGLMYFAEYKYGRLEHKMDHLACFGGKAFILGLRIASCRERRGLSYTLFKLLLCGVPSIGHGLKVESRNLVSQT